MLSASSSRLSILGCALLLLFTGCSTGDNPPPVPPRTEQAMALLPADARFAGMIDLQDLQANGGIAFSSERGVTIRFMDSDMTFNPLSAEQQNRLQTFIDATGFEPGSDLHAAYAASDSLQSHALLLAADVDRDRLLAHLDTEFGDQVTTTAYQSVPIVTLGLSGTGSGFQFALLDGGWIALSSKTATLQAVIDRSLDGNRAQTASRSPSPLVQQVAGRGGAWMTVRDLPSQHIAPSTDDDRMRQLARAVRDVATALKFEGDGVTGTVLLATDQDADDLADVARGLVSAVKLRETLTEEQRRLLDRVRITTQDEYVRINFEVDQATLARLLIETMQSGRSHEMATVR